MNQEEPSVTQHGLSTHPEPSGLGAHGAHSSGLTPTTAPDASFETGAGPGTTGFDSPAVTSSYLSDADVDAQSVEGQLYYPPGGGPEGARGPDTTEDAWLETP